MHLQLNNFHMANEVLYALDAVSNTSTGHLSRLTLQKVLYLSGAIAPLKDILLEFLRFNANTFGPYKGDIQETVDHLVGVGLVDIIYFERTKKRGAKPAGALSHYQISDSGKEVVSRLIVYPHEEEKAWWISLITKLTYTYMNAYGLEGAVDMKIKSLVYQDPTYSPFKNNKGFGKLIDLSENTGFTYQLTEFINGYLNNNELLPFKNNFRKNAELMVLSFFEYLYVNCLDESMVP